MELESRSDEGLADTPVEPGRVRAISLERAAEVSREIRDLISAGHERRAWELLRTLHPADMGSIVAGLPRSSREAMLRIMSPETVAWMFRQMNPAVAARIGTRIGAGMMSTILRQLRPQLALETLRRLPTPGPGDAAPPAHAHAPHSQGVGKRGEPARGYAGRVRTPRSLAGRSGGHYDGELS